MESLVWKELSLSLPNPITSSVKRLKLKDFQSDYTLSLSNKSFVLLLDQHAFTIT